MAKVLKKELNHLLFCPGPVNLALNVKQAALLNEIGHREPEFSDLLDSISKKLLKVYEIKSTQKYYAIVVTGSGSAANESVLSSVVHQKNILIISNGEFGERLYHISKIHNINTYHLAFKWGEKIDPKKVEEFIRKYGIQVIGVVHHETSIGILNPVEKLGRLAKKYDALFIVDTVSSAGADRIDLGKANISFCTGSASKAIGSLPGVSYVIGKKNEFEKLKNLPPKTAYLDLYKHYVYSKTKKQTPNTPAVQSFFALEQALDNIILQGPKNRRFHIKKTTRYLRAEMKKMNLKFLLKSNDMSSVLTTVFLPRNISFDDFCKKLRERNIIVYNGKGPLLGKVFQVGNIGELNYQTVSYFLQSLRHVLKELGHLKKPFKKITQQSYLPHQA